MNVQKVFDECALSFDRNIHLVNPAAGKGKVTLLSDTDACYRTTCAGDAETYVIRVLRENPRTHFWVYGGDGTLNEVINGIMRAGAGDTAAVTVVPTGTGNDFVRNFPRTGAEHRIDLIACNGRYAANMINIGFDCSVVAKTEELKRSPLVAGSMAYILGVAHVLCRRMGEELDVTITDAEGRRISYSGRFLLCAIGNGAYCGGGFRAAAAARLDDGLMDLLLVDCISRRRFIALVGSYKQGIHVSPDGAVAEEFRSVMRYHHCRKVEITGMRRICVDGEVSPAEHAEIACVPAALRYIELPHQET